MHDNILSIWGRLWATTLSSSAREIEVHDPKLHNHCPEHAAGFPPCSTSDFPTNSRVLKAWVRTTCSLVNRIITILRSIIFFIYLLGFPGDFISWYYQTKRSFLFSTCRHQFMKWYIWADILSFLGQNVNHAMSWSVLPLRKVLSVYGAGLTRESWTTFDHQGLPAKPNGVSKDGGSPPHKSYSMCALGLLVQWHGDGF